MPCLTDLRGVNEGYQASNQASNVAFVASRPPTSSFVPACRQSANTTNETSNLRASVADILSFLSDVNGEDERILLATPRGYCAGVDRTVDAVEKVLDLCGASVCVHKKIAHNGSVVESLTERSAIFVQETNEVPEGVRVVFSAHGVSPQVHEAAEARNLATIGATCPLMTKVYREVVRPAKNNYNIILVGHQGHEEIEGIYGEAPSYIQVVGTPGEIDSIEVRDPECVVWVS